MISMIRGTYKLDYLRPGSNKLHKSSRIKKFILYFFLFQKERFGKNYIAIRYIDFKWNHELCLYDIRNIHNMWKIAKSRRYFY